MVVMAQWAVLIWNVGIFFYELNAAQEKQTKKLTQQTDYVWDEEILAPVLRCFVVIVLATAGCFNHLLG